MTGKAIITHGNNAECPNVLSGEWTHCIGHSAADLIALPDGRTLAEVKKTIGKLEVMQLLHAIFECVEGDAELDNLKAEPIVKQLLAKHLDNAVAGFRGLIINRIMQLSEPGGPFNAFYLWQKKPWYGGKGPYFGWTRGTFEALPDADLVCHFETIIHAAYRQM